MSRRARESKKREKTVNQFQRRLRAALLRSIIVQHSEKMVCVRGVYGATETLGKTNSHFDPTQTGPHHHVEAAVDWCKIINIGNDYEQCLCASDPQTDCEAQWVCLRF